MVESCCHRRGTERTEWISDQIITFNGLASVYSSLPTEFVCRKGSGWQENEKITKICAKVHGENVKRNRLSIGPGKGMKVRCKGCWGKRGEKKKTRCGVLNSVVALIRVSAAEAIAEIGFSLEMTFLHLLSFFSFSFSPEGV